MKKLALILAVAFAACYRNPSPASLQPKTTIRVQNQGFADMTIYMLRSTERIRLGIAPGNSTVVLTIPANAIHGLTPLRFYADPIGGTRQPVSEEVTVSEGDEIGLMIPPV